MTLKADQIRSSDTIEDKLYHIVSDGFFLLTLILHFECVLFFLPTVTCPLECVRKNDPKGKKYFGTINVTKTGIPCQRWDSQTPHKHQFDELADHENHCRNPDEDNGPWCYTTNDTQRYDFCPVPHC